MKASQQIVSLLIAVILDLVLADPYSWPHPVKFMGNYINFFTRHTRAFERSPRMKRFLSMGLLLSTVGLSLLICYLVLYLAKKINFYLYFAVHTYIIYSSISMEGMAREAKKVVRAYDMYGIDQARRSLSMIVGRSTEELSKEEVYAAVIETTAENTADGVFAPIFYALIFGPMGAILYKAINTMDSMVAYRTEKYIDYGRYPAIVDDIFNLVPARLSAIFMVLAGFILKLDVKNSIRIIKRDKRAHLSPNSAYPESAVAGLLGIRLGGSHTYNGQLIEKPSIGDSFKKIQREDVEKTIKILYTSSLLFLFTSVLIKYIIYII